MQINEVMILLNYLLLIIYLILLLFFFPPDFNELKILDFLVKYLADCWSSTPHVKQWYIPYPF